MPLTVYEKFPSPFNEDHFISAFNDNKTQPVDCFRPLLTRIISYHMGEFYSDEEPVEFPSPFNEDHFISTK